MDFKPLATTIVNNIGGKDNVIPLNLPTAISEEFARLILTEFSIPENIPIGHRRGDYFYMTF